MQAEFGPLLVPVPWEARGGKGWTSVPLTTSVIISSPIPEPLPFTHAGDSRILQQVFNAIWLLEFAILVPQLNPHPRQACRSSFWI